ncbi:MAG: FAD-binding oxidoreductase [Sulfitobacter sp.]
MKQHQEIIVVGAGIVGISIALKLQAGGATVRVLDRKASIARASLGNAGAFAFSDVIPLATPGIMRTAPKWLLDPMGPLSIPPSYALKIAPWMLRFWRASWQDRYQASVNAQARLMELSQAALERQIMEVDGEGLMQREGQLQLYEGEKEYAASLAAWKLRRRHGVKFRVLETPQAIAEIQPGLHPRFTHAAFTPDWLNTTDPKEWSEHLAQRFCNRGGVIEQVNVTSISGQSEKAVVMTSNGRREVDKVVVAAGAWSHHLARTLGDKIPLETERGYNTTLPKGAFDLRTHLTFAGHGFVVSKIAGGVRVGGAVELGGLTLPPNYKRAEVLLQKAAQFLPDLDAKGGKQWMGFRPSMPDSLPVIGPAQNAANVIYAFGHGHLGLTQSAGTAELVASLIFDREPIIPITPYSPNRF